MTWTLFRRSIYVSGGHDRAPHAPRRSDRPGEPGALLDPSRAHGFRWGATTGPPTPPDARIAPGNPARSSIPRVLMVSGGGPRQGPPPPPPPPPCPRKPPA